MQERFDVPVAELTTLRLGGPAKRLVDVDDAGNLVEVIRGCDANREPVLVLGGGSNLVVADEGFPGTVLRVGVRGMTVERNGSPDEVTVRVGAGENWDSFVTKTVAEGWAGVEALAGIPGLVGAVPIQNVAAYGQEVAQTLVDVLVWDRVDGVHRTLPVDACGFGYRTSRFKRDPDRAVVLEVAFRLSVGELSAPVGYAELARTLGVDMGDRAPLDEVRSAVLALRRRKGMVLDPVDHDTWSAGSFFTNPVLSPDIAATCRPRLLGGRPSTGRSRRARPG